MPKLRFLGHLLGWALRNRYKLDLPLTLAFWRRVINHTPGGFTYSLDDLQTLDSHLWTFCSQILQAETSLNDQEFLDKYGTQNF